VCKRSQFSRAEHVKSCITGCKNQEESLNEAKGQYDTPSALLLGNALDSCWAGCMENETTWTGRKACNYGCQQRQQLQMKNQGYENVMDTEEEGDSSQEMNEISDEMPKEDPSNGEEDGENWTTFVLVRPHFFNDFDATVREHFAYMDQMRQQMLGWVFQDLMSADDTDQDNTISAEEPQSHVYYRQYVGVPKLPQQSSTLYDRASSGLKDLKNQALTSLTNLKKDIKTAFSSAHLNDSLMCILIGTSIILMLASFLSWVYDSCVARQSRLLEDDGNYYKLASLPHPPYLPTYDDCIKADKTSLRDVDDLGEYFKVNLSYPAPMVVEMNDEKKVKL